MNTRRFREQAALCRRLAKQATTPDMAQRLGVLANEYDEMAERVERKMKSRRVEGGPVEEAPVPA